MCVCAYTHKDVPSQTPQKNLGMLPQVQQKMYFHSHPLPKKLCTPAEGAPSVNSSSAGSGLHGQ